MENDDKIVYSSLDDTTSYVLLEELWNEETNSFYSGTVKELFNLIGGKSGTTIEDIKTLASSTKKASNLRTNTYKKKSTQDINVMLGGLEWTVCYLSNDNSGNPILTLWLSNSTQEKFKDREQDEGEYYGFFDGGLYSSFWIGSEANVLTNYPNNMYGTSYVRAVTLNNGGKYTSNGQTLTEVEQNENSVFSLFTMEGNGLTDYIVKPADVSWQEYQSAKELGYGHNYSNDAWGEMPDDGFGTTEGGLSNNYSSKDGYDAWKNDYIWIVSSAETTLWGTNIYQKSNYDGITSSLTCSVGSESKSSVVTYSMKRSAHDIWCVDTYNIYTNGYSQTSFSGKDNLTGIRPALHLNLNAIAESLSEENCYEIVYNLDDGESGVYPTKMENTSEFILTNPTKSGYKFLGWQISGADYSTAMFGKNSANLSITSADMTCYVENCDKLHFKNLTSTGGSVTLKAIWQSTGEVMVQYKSYDDYFTDYDISSSTITENDLSGSGTSTDPYRAKTTKGFLYLTNKTKSGINLNNKYVEIECDILLNDETFDERGNPLSGDGIVYSWQPIATGNNCIINGNNHTIIGLYYNNQEKSEFSMFSNNVTPKLIENLKLSNVFVRVIGYSGVLAYEAEKIVNCHILNGIMIAPSGYSSGFSRYVVNCLEKCTNGLNIIAGSRVGGFIDSLTSNSDLVIKDCEFYGSISAQHIAGGIIAYPNDEKVHIENCVNKGNIQCSGTVGGIVGNIYNYYGFKHGKIYNCVNYGTIEDISSTNNYAGGIAGSIDGLWDIYNCTNYGNVYSNGYAGSLVGRICAVTGYNYGGATYETRIVNCKSYLKESIPVFGYIMAGYADCVMLHLTIKGLIADYDLDKDMGSYALARYVAYLYNGTEINITDSKINIKCKKFDTYMAYNGISFKNTLINVECQTLSTKNNYLSRYQTSWQTFDSVILNINLPSTSVKQYYGSSFNNFYISWRTGKIGLKSLDGVGYFQGAIDETWLTDNGFVKKN